MLNNPLQLISLLSNAQNPMAIMQQLLGNQPQFKQVMEIAKDKSPEELKKYVKNLCNSQGINLDSLAKQFNLPLE